MTWLALYGVLLAIGQLMFKLASLNKPDTSMIASNFMNKILFVCFNPYFVGAIVLYAVSTFLWVSILSTYEVSSAYPFAIAISILFTTFFGISLFSETITPGKIVSIFLIALGVFLMRDL